MLYIKKRYICLLIVFAFLRRSEERKIRKVKLQYQPPLLTEYPTTKYLPSDLQVTAFLRQGENKTYFYWSPISNSHMSITIITCTSPVHWSIGYRPNNTTDIDINKENPKQDRIAADIDTYTTWSSKGLYILNLSSEKTSYVHLYISTTIEFPSEILQESHFHDIRLLKRRRRKRLTVRWDPSLVDPHVTEYCLVINTKKPYKTLCSAQGDISNGSLHLNKPIADSQVVRYYEHKELKKVDYLAPRINCVGDKTHYTLSNLQQGQYYYFNVFATNRQTNLTYPYGSAYTKFDKHIKPTYLRDGKLTFVNLKKLDGKAVFTYKLGRKSNNSLEFFIVTCGGAVDVEVILKYDIFKSKTRIKGFGNFEIQEPKVGIRYYLRVLTNPYDLGRTTGVKVLATTKPSKIPFPTLPTETVVHEYISLRKCDSITIGWHASPSRSDSHYCFAIRRGRLPDVGEYKKPDNCGNDFRLKSLAEISYCKDIKQKSGTIITEKIDRLRPGENYIIYVTVKKRKGRALAYDLLQVHTKSECD